MQLTQAAVRLEAAVEAQVRLGDAELQSLASELLEVLRPAMRQTLMDVAEMAAQEVSGQLTGQRVDVRLVDGDPELIVVVDEPRTTPSPTGDPVEAEARITLRLPAQLKDLITEAAEVAGDSINSFVVDALRTRAYERPSTSSIRDTIDL
jgi:hypothetical protein